MTCGESFGMEFIQWGQRERERDRKREREKERRGEEGGRELPLQKKNKERKKGRENGNHLTLAGMGRSGVGGVYLLKGQGTKVTGQANKIIIITQVT